MLRGVRPFPDCRTELVLPFVMTRTAAVELVLAVRDDTKGGIGCSSYLGVRLLPGSVTTRTAAVIYDGTYFGEVMFT